MVSFYITANGYSFAIRFLFFTKTGAKVVLPEVAFVRLLN